MCGIVGMVAVGSAFERARYSGALESLACAAESRGKDSSGVMIRSAVEAEFKVFKAATQLTELWHSLEVATTLARELRLHEAEGRIVAVAAHSRLVTNGTQLVSENNHPVVKDGVLGIHNGIIVNDEKLWALHPCLTRRYEVDTEVYLSLVREYLNSGLSTADAISRAAKEATGTLSACLMFTDRPELALLTNCGSMYVLSDGGSIMFFSSERHPLQQIATSHGFGESDGFELRPISSGAGLLVGLDTFTLRDFTFWAGVPHVSIAIQPPLPVRQANLGRPPVDVALIQDVRKIASAVAAPRQERQLEFNIERIDGLVRCARCILPTTFPFIEFDEAGVCSYCRRSPVRKIVKTVEQLEALVDPYRAAGGRQDCIVPFSGGRDSTFTLHFVKRELGLNPIAFTYDWGMVTDLGRRNIARVCGKLGVENVIVAADIRKKRENIRKNVTAWLQRPHLGMVPLFMAGDKYFYYYTAQLRRQTGVDLNIWGVNPLENTDFKVGFLGVPPDPAKEHIYSLNTTRKLRLLAGVTGAVVRNPNYVNSSVVDSVGSFASRSLMRHEHYHHLFDYVRWDESQVEALVREEYDWETASDTSTTWRVGDGTAAFYNYIYYTVAGFSEHDTFRSNQVREGMLTREQALGRAREDNRPRYATIKWYTEVVGLEYESVIARINAIPKLY